jgi:hypothetical protein
MSGLVLATALAVQAAPRSGISAQPAAEYKPVRPGSEVVRENEGRDAFLALVDIEQEIVVIEGGPADDVV